MFFHCGYFDHPDLQSLKQLHIVFWSTNINFKKLGAFNIPLQRYGNAFPTVYYMPKFIKTIAIAK